MMAEISLWTGASTAPPRRRCPPREAKSVKCYCITTPMGADFTIASADDEYFGRGLSARLSPELAGLSPHLRQNSRRQPSAFSISSSTQARLRAIVLPSASLTWRLRCFATRHIYDVESGVERHLTRPPSLPRAMDAMISRRCIAMIFGIICQRFRQASARRAAISRPFSWFISFSTPDDRCAPFRRL